ncbi:MAG: hypothetical protein KGH98_04365 [Candidatus Micrarchaeota archaeon]|nr:hypothetical protein [Candidatus Micrarchaeota archaeon]
MTYGSISSLLILPAIFWAAFVLLLLVLAFRYTLLENYPYLINLPSFLYKLSAMGDPAKEGAVVNRVFTVFSLSVLYAALLNLLITTGAVLQSSVVLIAIPILVTAFVIATFGLYWNIYRGFAANAKTRRKR